MLFEPGDERRFSVRTFILLAAQFLVEYKPAYAVKKRHLLCLAICVLMGAYVDTLRMRGSLFVFAGVTSVCMGCMLWALAGRLEQYMHNNMIMPEHVLLKESLSACSASLLKCTDTVEKMSLDKGTKLDEQSWHKQMRQGGWAMPAVYVGDMHDAGLDSRWVSQVGQDRTVFHLFKGKRGGFFVDLAAHDAVDLSNTLTLEQAYGWGGICLEANPKYFEKLYLRKCQVVQAAVGRVDNERANFNFRNEFGGLVGNSFDNKEGGGGDVRTRATVSLERVFNDLSVPDVIDYMSLDIEGAEEWVFETFPWHRYTVLVLTVERPKEKLVEMLKSHGYIYVCDHGDFGDQMWLHSTFPDMQSVIASLNLDGRKVCSGVY